MEIELLRKAILRTLAYADVFDYPLTLAEIHRYLIERDATFQVVSWVVQEFLEPGEDVCRSGDFYTLPGRESLVSHREQRLEIARQLWPYAIRFGLLIARLPSVRMVAVTGALAMNNVESYADIDYLVVTRPGRLWLARALIIAVVRAAAQSGVTLCPNYILAENSLAYPAPSLYPAHELAQMIPLSGGRIYLQMRAANQWTECFLPNAAGMPSSEFIPAAQPDRTRWQALGERLMQVPALEKVELWEMKRKIHKFQRQYPYHAESAFTRDWCKGHFDGHGQRTIQSYQQRLKSLNLITEI